MKRKNPSERTGDRYQKSEVTPPKIVKNHNGARNNEVQRVNNKIV